MKKSGERRAASAGRKKPERAAGHAHRAEPEVVEELLRSHGLRLTPARRSVTALLIGAGRPLSRQDIVNGLPAGADAVTVYRTLAALVEAGIVHETYIEDRHKLYETAHRCHKDRCHPHFTCRGCGETTCMTDAVVPLVSNLNKGFLAERQKVLIQGLCPGCAGKQQAVRSEQ